VAVEVDLSVGHLKSFVTGPFPLDPELPTGFVLVGLLLGGFGVVGLLLGGFGVVGLLLGGFGVVGLLLGGFGVVGLLIGGFGEGLSGMGQSPSPSSLLLTNKAKSSLQYPQ